MEGPVVIEMENMEIYNCETKKWKPLSTFTDTEVNMAQINESIGKTQKARTSKQTKMPKGEPVIMKLKTNMEQGKDVVFTPITNPIHKDLHLHEVVVKVQKDGMIKVPISNMNIKTMRTAPSAVQVGAVTELKDQTTVSGSYISGLSKTIIESESKKLKDSKQRRFRDIDRSIK
jgi:hypothetical protein